MKQIVPYWKHASIMAVLVLIEKSDNGIQFTFCHHRTLQVFCDNKWWPSWQIFDSAHKTTKYQAQKGNGIDKFKQSLG